MVYEIYGFMEHRGRSRFSGHWVSYIQAPNDVSTWVLFDDQMRRPVTLSKAEALQRQPNVLFYRKRKFIRIPVIRVFTLKIA